jgi:hypothetical protein
MIMKNIGLYLVIFGIGSMIMNQFGYEFRLLMWIDNWGETVGWAIRGGAAVIGAVLWFVGYSQQTKSDSQPEEV